MRVLYFVSEFPRLHGAQRSLLQLVRHVGTSGVEPLVVFPAEGRCSEAYREAGVPVEVVEGPEAFRRFGQALLRGPAAGKLGVFLRQVLPYGRRLARLARDRGATLVHCATPRSLLLAGPGLRLSGIPVVGHVRGLLTPYSRLHRALIGGLATRSILVAHGLEAELPSRYRRRCVTIHNGVDASSFGLPAARSMAPDASSGGPHVVTVSALVPEKGQHHLIAAMRLVREHCPDARLTLVGAALDERYQRHLERLANETGGVDLVGWVQNPVAYYEAATVVVLPSVVRETVDTAEGPLEARSGEGLPRTVLEAMYLGKAIVSSAVAGTPEMLDDGRAGVLVPAGDPQALSAAIVALLRDPSRREALGKAAATRARSVFNTERMVQDTVAVYREIEAARA